MTTTLRAVVLEAHGGHRKRQIVALPIPDPRNDD